MKTGNFQVKVLRRIQDISPDDWMSVFPNVLENYYFFKTLDESRFEQFSFFYIILYEDGRPIGATTAFLMRFPLDIVVKGFLRNAFDLIKKFFPNIFSPCVIICGLPMGAGRIGITDKRQAVMEAISESIETIANDQGASMIIYKDFTEKYDDMLKPLIKKGFSRVESLPSTEMEVTFESFEDYLKKLSRSSREGLKRKFKQIDGKVNIQMEIVRSLDNEVLGQVYGLYLQTFKKQDLGLEKLTMDFFKNISLNMPEETMFFLWRIEGKLVAFAFCLVSGDYFLDYYLGFDYNVAFRYHLYFVRFRDLLVWCINNGIRKYDMGVTTYEPKRRLGFGFLRYYFYMKHRNKLLNPFVTFFSLFMKPEHHDPVFKEMDTASEHR